MLHRVDDWRTLDSARFFALVDRLAYYPGALRGRLQREATERGSARAEPTPAEADAALAELAAAGIVSWKRG